MFKCLKKGKITNRKSILTKYWGSGKYQQSIKREHVLRSRKTITNNKVTKVWWIVTKIRLWNLTSTFELKASILQRFWEWNQK